ncbi:MAG: hypothetical protein WBA46_18490 [Thermomicrobiales bacterium]
MTAGDTSLDQRCRDLFLASDEGRRHVAFFAAVPDALLPWMVPFWWHLDRLLALDLPVAHLPMTALRPFLAVPFWRAGIHAGLFQLNAWDVLADPVRHADHWQRTMAADLHYPLTCYRLGDRLTLLDGYHRLLKAEATGVDSLPIVVVPEGAVDGLLVRDGFLGELNALRDASGPRAPDLVPTLRRVARALRDEYPAGTFPAWA